MAFRVYTIDPPIKMEEGKAYYVGWDDRGWPYIVEMDDQKDARSMPPGAVLVAAATGTVSKISKWWKSDDNTATD